MKSSQTNIFFKATCLLWLVVLVLKFEVILKKQEPARKLSAIKSVFKTLKIKLNFFMKPILVIWRSYTLNGFINENRIKSLKHYKEWSENVLGVPVAGWR